MGNLACRQGNPRFKYIRNYYPSKFSTSISQEKTHYIVLICLGESQNLIENQNYKVLSEIGKEQASDIGFQIKLNLLGINFQEINIFTSHYINSIETSLYMVNNFDFDDISNKILYIDKNLSDTSEDLNSKDLYDKLILPLYNGKKFSLGNRLINKDQAKCDKSNQFNEVTEKIYNHILNKYSNVNNNSLNIICTQKENLNHILSKLISIMNLNKDNKIYSELNKTINFCTAYCFRMSFSKQNNYSYLGKFVPNRIFINKIMKENKKINNRFIAILRHGERIDGTPKRKYQELPREDPELTYRGMRQAMNIGMQLYNYFLEENIEINNINIFSSPSTRTLQTGILASGIVDYSDCLEKTIRVITDLITTNVEDGLENNKEDSPIYYHKDKDKKLKRFYDKYITQLIKERNFHYDNLEFTSMLGKDEFESYNDRIKRAQNVITNICRFSKTSFNKGENNLNIIATHRFNFYMIVEFLMKQLNKQLKEKGLKEINIKDNDISFGYCHCYMFKYNETDEISFIGLFKPDIY